MMASASTKKIYIILALVPWFNAAISKGVVDLNEDSWYQVTEGEWMMKL